MQLPLPHAVFSGPNVWEDFELFLHAQGYLQKKIFVLCDANTHEHCLPILLGNCGFLIDLEILEVDPGEENKCVEVAQQLWEALTELEADRNSLLINLGGGVVTDLGGFVAAVFKRGIPFVNIPTSLLGMTDAAWGGKTGIDLQNFKNQIGTFTYPVAVCLDPEFLETLPARELAAGWAELLKHGIIASKSHFDSLVAYLQSPDFEAVNELIADSVAIKAAIVAADVQEQNVRMLLNAGHTIGHALETYGLNHQHNWLHGEAVAAGLLCEAYIAHEMQFLTSQDFQKIAQLVLQYFPILNFPASAIDEIVATITHDKKRRGHQIKMPIVKEIGQASMHNIENFALFNAALHYYRTRTGA